MYVIYWQDFPVNPSVIFDSKLHGPNPGLGCIHIKWLWIIYFRNDRLEKMCFAHEKWKPTACQVSCFLTILIFPFSLYFNFSSFWLKGLEWIQKQIGKGLATCSLAPGWVRPPPGGWEGNNHNHLWHSVSSLGIQQDNERRWYHTFCRLTWVKWLS